MTNEITTRNPNQLSEAIEAALLDGDLSKLDVKQRLQLVQACCDAAGLNMQSRPFAYIRTKEQKLILYALKGASEQLNAIHGISHKLTSTNYDEKGGTMEAWVEATTRDGRSTFEVGATATQGLKGADLANAKMKAVTKAKRRATLSLCGLGHMPDESELETMGPVQQCTDSGQPIKPDNGSGFASGMYCTEEQALAWIRALGEYRDTRNQKWIDHWTDKQGNVQEGITELCPRIFQLDNHLVKWAVHVGLLKPESVPETGMKAAQLGRLTGILYHGEKAIRTKLVREVARYLDEQERIQLQRLEMDHPELFEAEIADEAKAEDDWEPGGEG